MVLKKFIEGKLIFVFLKCSEIAACLERLNSATASQEPAVENHSPTGLFHIRSRGHLDLIIIVCEKCELKVSVPGKFKGTQA
jgi:hypothetical protein